MKIPNTVDLMSNNENTKTSRFGVSEQKRTIQISHIFKTCQNIKIILKVRILGTHAYLVS